MKMWLAIGEEPGSDSWDAEVPEAKIVFLSRAELRCLRNSWGMCTAAAVEVLDSGNTLFQHRKYSLICSAILSTNIFCSLLLSFTELLTD